MSAERRSGIIPTHIFIVGEEEGRVVATDDLLQAYKSNGYSPKDIANEAYLLAEARKETGVDDDIRAWTDAEKLVAIQHGLVSGEKNDDSGNNAA